GVRFGTGDHPRPTLRQRPALLTHTGADELPGIGLTQTLGYGLLDGALNDSPRLLLSGARNLSDFRGAVGGDPGADAAVVLVFGSLALLRAAVLLGCSRTRPPNVSMAAVHSASSIRSMRRR